MCALVWILIAAPSAHVCDDDSRVVHPDHHVLQQRFQARAVFGRQPAATDITIGFNDIVALGGTEGGNKMLLIFQALTGLR